MNAEPRITLLAEHRAMEVETDANRITAVVIQSTRTGHQKRLKGTLFADCTGDAKVGFLAGVYESHLPDLIALMKQPGTTRVA